MKRLRTLKKRPYKKTSIFVSFIANNKNYFIITGAILIIGIIFGVLLVNNLSNTELINTKTFIDNAVIQIKDNVFYPKVQLLKSSIAKDLLIIVIAWILGISFLGKYLLNIVPLAFGVMFGYTASSVIYAMQFVQGVAFLFSSMFFQTVIKVLTISFLNVCNIKFHNELKYKNNFKSFIVKYTVSCFFCLIMLILSSLVEVFVSGNLLINISKIL